MEQNNLERYSLIKTKMPREFLLLQGKGCVWKKCSFCDYFHDTCDNPFAINKPVIELITGQFGVVDVINSGSAFELDNDTLNFLRTTLYQKNIKTLWLETHWLYHNRLNEIREFFAGIDVKFRVGVESFDPATRNAWNKGIPSNVTPENIAKKFDGCCLLICVQGQSKEIILSDIETADRLFGYYSINVFNENSTSLKTDKSLLKWFVDEVYPHYKDNPHAEILINNSDLGVG